MGIPVEGSASRLSRFADRVLCRARGGTGIAVYEHADGSLGFLARAEDVAVTFTVRRRVSFKARCRACGVTVATCTTAEGARVTTPCLCSDEREWRDATERGALLFRVPETDVDSFAARVYEELARDEPFVLFGMVRGFVRRYWPIMGCRPEARLWARFYRHTG